MKARNVLWYMTFFGFAINYMIRININIAIVAMVKPSKIFNKFGTTECENQEKIVHDNTTTKILNTDNLFEWDEYEQNLLLSSFYWCHWLTQIPGGLLAHRYGTKITFGMSNFLAVLLSFMIPVASYFSFNLLIAIRVLQGLICGTSWPAMHSMVAKWVPPCERGKFVSAYLGSSVGAALTYFFCGYIIDYFGWEYVFYVTSSVGTIWYILWLIMVYESPRDHPRISYKEKEYIITSIGSSLHEERLPVPWKSLLRSPAVLINSIAQFGVTWGLFALLSHTPTYLKFIHGLHIKTTGALSGFPYLTRWIFSYAFDLFGQLLLRKNMLTVTNVRKLACVVCSICVGIVFIGLAYVGCNTSMAVVLLIIAVTMNGSTSSGPLASVIDMSPNFSGVLQGICGIGSVLPGFVCPLILGYLTQHNQTSAQWQKFFFVSAGVCIFCGVLYVFYGTAKLQKWNDPGLSKTKEMLPLQNSSINNH